MWIELLDNEWIRADRIIHVMVEDFNDSDGWYILGKTVDDELLRIKGPFPNKDEAISEMMNTLRII